ncbi:uncharacterized protein LOC119383539 [Rhipicephalus sanguineus]|uniref:uncharacterized protein LOC119383539 n=1 Tax=Rhipicephalus sanguineus TaxID=34632 RepID=UPI001893B640|nr:uncharacterized protein LOC119383539 [Rhipicephalus sanguineus]
MLDEALTLWKRSQLKRSISSAVQRKGLLMCFVLLAAATASKSVGHQPCAKIKSQCRNQHTRPNCLTKHGTEYFQCSPKNQECHFAWGRHCEDFISISCYIRRNYCECLCEVRSNSKPKVPRPGSPRLQVRQNVNGRRQ